MARGVLQVKSSKSVEAMRGHSRFRPYRRSLMCTRFTRRAFLKLAGAAATTGLASSFLRTSAAVQTAWNAGPLAHLIPGANHERFLIKSSFTATLDRAPVLRVRERRVQGAMTDTQGHCWMFDVTGLAPATSYDLQIVDADGRALCDPWPLKTFPAPGTRPDRLRLLAFTCAGGFDGPPLAGKTFWLDMTARRKLLDRGLSFAPDVLIANGDHIYWDQETTLNKPKAQAEHVVQYWWGRFGTLDRSMPILGTKNEAVVKAIADYQIG